jgi:molybdate transport system substrate-binding protein
MELYKIVTIVAFATLLAVLGPPDQRPVRRDLLVAAAASLGGIAPELTSALHESTGIDVRFNFAGSNTLARQIIEGARMDVFVSADEAQMDVVEKAGRLVAGSRVDVVGNQLVLITAESARPHLIRPDDLTTPSVRRVAMGDPAAVPAGVYGRRWLETIRLWSAVEPKVVPLPSSPAVVAAVAEGRADVGVVYVTDVTTRRGTHIAHRVSAGDAPRIVYPAAAITGGRIPLAKDFIEFLRSPRAQQIFAAGGFQPVDVR